MINREFGNVGVMYGGNFLTKYERIYTFPVWVLRNLKNHGTCFVSEYTYKSINFEESEKALVEIFNEKKFENGYVLIGSCYTEDDLGGVNLVSARVLY